MKFFLTFHLKSSQLYFSKNRQHQVKDNIIIFMLKIT